VARDAQGRWALPVGAGHGLIDLMSPVLSGRSARSNLKTLVGSGNRIGLFTLPFLLVGLILNVAYPSLFDVGGPPIALRVISAVVSAAGVAIWAWSVTLIMTRVPRGELITEGPYALVRHPLYTAVALLVLPWLGFLLNTWLGALVGVALYVGSRMFAPAEEAALSKTFGAAWTAYSKAVKIPWL
jgi:protein-S-isoprenylcysteine O-methyltransferase Ste14